MQHHKNFKLLILAISALIISFGCIAAVENYREVKHTQSQIKRLETERQQLHDKNQELENSNTQTEKQLEDQKKLEEQLRNEIKNLQAMKAEKARLAALASSPKAFAEEPVRASGSCADWMAAAGIPDMYSTHKLIINESGCNPNAVNPDSGACGIPQALPCSKIAHCGVDPVCQLRWMDQYVKGRYGSWDGALAAWNARYPHWY